MNAELIAGLRRGDGNGCGRANELMRRAADALEAEQQKYAELLVAGEHQRRANRRKNAAQTDATKADAWDQGLAAAVQRSYWARNGLIPNPYREVSA